MKQIGHVDRALTAPADWKTHTLGMLSPYELFIPNPGERENVSADQWIHVGWVDPDKDGGQIWSSHAEAGDNSRPAYVQREAVAVAPVHTGPDRIHHPLPPNDKHGIPTDELLSEALEFCTACIDGVDYPDPISRRKQFDECAVYIRELVRRFPADPAPSVAADRPMTFYDHAFIHAAINHADYYSESTMTQAVIDDAHKIASMLTRNRANKP